MKLSIALVVVAAGLEIACGDSSSASGGGEGGSGASGAAGAGTQGGAEAGGGGQGGDGQGGDGQGGAESCIGSSLLASLGREGLMVGVSTTDEIAGSAPFDVRYLYISGGIPDGAGPCGSCAAGCTSGGTSCDNQSGCAWWGCWQYDQDPPGAYVRGFVAAAAADQQIPMFTYYMALQASGVGEGGAEVDVMNDVTFLSRYLADYRFLLQNIGDAPAIVHIEPDFWGYAEQKSGDPHALPAAVPAANPTDCGGEEASIAGLGRCMIAMGHAYAPQAAIALHGSGWATAIDVLGNTDGSFDVPGEAAKLGAFLAECGPDADLVVVDAADRDAEYYESIGQDRWWDDTNATLPNFHQAFAWAQALSETLGKAHLWWQVPVGNMSLSGGTDHYRDNRLDYFFAHWAEVATAHGVGAAFGAGAGGMTTPETDGGNLVAKTIAYRSGGGQPLCP